MYVAVSSFPTPPIYCMHCIMRELCTVHQHHQTQNEGYFSIHDDCFEHTLSLLQCEHAKNLKLALFWYITD